MTERASMKEFTQYQHKRSNISTNSFRLLIMLEGSRGHILNVFQTSSDTGNTPKKRFLSKKGPKEGERVARGHFHERVGESPRRYENFGTSGSSVAFFVSEIQPFENCLGSKSTFNSKF